MSNRRRTKVERMAKLLHNTKRYQHMQKSRSYLDEKEGKRRFQAQVEQFEQGLEQIKSDADV